MTDKPKVSTLIRHGVSRVAMRQKTFDAMERLDEQEKKYGTRQADTPIIKLDSKALDEFDRSVVLDGIRKDQGCELVAKALKCSLDAAAERILQLIVAGHMTIGIHEGRIRIGITRDGWKEVSRKLR